MYPEGSAMCRGQLWQINKPLTQRGDLHYGDHHQIPRGYVYCMSLLLLHLCTLGISESVGETGAGWRMGQVDFFDLSEYYWTNRTMAPSTDQRYDYAQL